MPEASDRSRRPPQPDTASERRDLQAFGEAVLADRSLHDRLRATRDLDTFVELALLLGAERGYAFSELLLREVLNEKRRAWLERWL